MGQPLKSLTLRVGVVAWLSCAAVTGVNADDAGDNFSLRQGRTCLQADSLKARVSELLGRGLPPAGAAAELRVWGSPDDPRSVSVEVAVDGEVRATRQFAPGPPLCEDLLDAVAIASAMMLQALPPETWVDAETTEIAPEPPPPEPPPPLPPPTQPQAQAPPAAPAIVPPAPVQWRAEAAAPEDPKPRPLRLRLGAAALSLLQADGPGWGGSAGLALSTGNHVVLHGDFAVVGWPDRVLAGGQGRYQSQLLAGELAVCAGQHDTRTWRLLACLGAFAGRQRIPESPLRGRTRVSQGGVVAGLEGQWRLSAAFRFFARAGLTVGLRPVEVAVQDASGHTVSATSIARAYATLALGLRVTIFAKPSDASGMDET